MFSSFISMHLSMFSSRGVGGGGGERECDYTRELDNFEKN